MGDNRGASNDSRIFGPVPENRVLGRAWVSYWPPDDLGLVE
jgi:signal peptidase I